MDKTINPPHVLLENIILMSVTFEREPQINIVEPSMVVHDTSVDVSTSEVKEDRFVVFLKVDHDVKYANQRIVKIQAVYAGTFQKVGENTKEELDTFLNINAPAIIFPFVREIVASMTSKAMVGAILIQPVNFVQLYNSKKAKTNE